jgi:hypothetical protein
VEVHRFQGLVLIKLPPVQAVTRATGRGDDVSPFFCTVSRAGDDPPGLTVYRARAADPLLIVATKGRAAVAAITILGRTQLRPLACSRGRSQV